MPPGPIWTRRRDLAATQHTPSLPLYGAPLTPLATAPTTMTAVPGPPHPDSSIGEESDRSERPRPRLPSCRAAWFRSRIGPEPLPSSRPTPTRRSRQLPGQSSTPRTTGRGNSTRPGIQPTNPTTPREFLTRTSSTAVHMRMASPAWSIAQAPCRSPRIITATCSQLRTDAGQSRSVNHTRADNFVLGAAPAETTAVYRLLTVAVLLPPAARRAGGRGDESRALTSSRPGELIGPHPG